jgi:hypothetical protein
MAQIYNSKKKFKASENSDICANDPYFAIILQCKEDEVNPETSFVRRVTAAPEPTALLASDSQLSDIEKYCTNTSNFDLGPFHVTATQYENLHLLDRRSGKHPAMILCTSAVRKKKRPMKDSLIKCLN